jgi:uncharacterized membrane protein
MRFVEGSQRRSGKILTPPGSEKIVLLKAPLRGSFPHPDVLRQLDGCVANGAERAFALTEREQEHRHKCDRKSVDAQVDLISAHIRKTDAENRDRRLIIVMAFIFAILATVAAFIAVINDHPAGAGIIGGGTVAIILALLRVGRGAGPDKDNKDGSP